MDHSSGKPRNLKERLLQAALFLHYDDGDDSGGVGSDDGVVMTVAVAMKLRDDGDDAGMVIKLR